jgi:OmpA-OmpF porin, OOP family
MTNRAMFVVFACLLAALPAAAQDPGDPDAEGCRDSALLTRMPGCTIAECTTKEFDTAELQVGAIKDGNTQTRELEGALHSLHYACPAKLSLLQVQRNAEAALKRAGFTVVAAGKGEGDYPFVTARKGAHWIEVRGAENTNDYTHYIQTNVKVEEMKQDLQADATAFEEEINRSGAVAVYGINFDTAKATFQEGSGQVLMEIAKLMKARPEWRFEVQGHTDNVGAKGTNQTLSEQRAKAVVAWLTRNGVDASRLEAKGLGDTKPVAGNDSDEGRAKNRRVELRKLNEEQEPGAGGWEPE